MKLNLISKIKSSLRNPTITNVLIVAVVTILVKAVSFSKEIIIADSFGLSELLDTFYIAVLIPSFISGVFLGSFKSVFIPNYISELKANRNIGSFQSTSFILTIGVALFFLLISFLSTDVYLETLFSGHTEAYYNLIKTQFYFVAPCILFWGFSSIISGLLTIDDEFKFSSMSSVFTPISIIVCLLLFKDELGSVVLAVGTLIGSILNCIFLIIVALNRKILVLKKPDFVSENVLILFKQLPSKLSSGLISGINPLVDQYFATQLVVGSLSALNYGIKIPMFSIGIMGIALGNVLLPYFSKKAFDNKSGTFIELKKILKNTLIVSSVVTILLVLLSEPIIRLIFERNAFTSSDTEIVSQIQQMYLLQIPFYITGLIMVKFLTSINKNNFMVLTAAFNLILNFVLNYILIETMGVYGLALATSIVSMSNVLILYIYINYLNKSDV